MNIPCPCCSGQTYAACCQLYHQEAVPETALQLMRSRYSAFALNLPDYIIDTTHPASPQFAENKFNWRRSLARFLETSTFQRLEVHDFKANDNLAIVTFTAYLSRDERDCSFTEKSYFIRLKGRWLYLSGQVAPGYVPELTAISHLRLLPMAYYGDSVLRQKAEPILAVTDAIEKLVEDMIETMDALNGIGLAAPQVHHSKRIFLIRTPAEIEPGKYEFGDVKVFINPTLSFSSAERVRAVEGCLSIPSLQAEVERAKEVTIEYSSLDGKTFREEVRGLEARMIQHEYDHIEGILYIDRLSEQEQATLQPALQNLEARIHGRKGQ